LSKTAKITEKTYFSATGGNEKSDKNPTSNCLRLASGPQGREEIMNKNSIKLIHI
jgi:hypothetical protein